MSKTSQENKAKKAKLAVEVPAEISEQKAPDLSAEAPANTETEVAQTTDSPIVAETIIKKIRVRGKKYLAAKKLVEPTKFYPLSEAVDLVKKTAYSKFPGKVEAHVTVFDIGNIGEITFPHLETAAKKIVILNDTVLSQIKESKLDFDILIATPATMSKLLPHARLLGPKGLMPNPKNGTLTDKPEEAVKRLSAAKETVKTEKKAPVVHIIVGQTSQPEKELEANLTELIKVIRPNKIKKLSICATMGPSVKVAIDKSA